MKEIACKVCLDNSEKEQIQITEKQYGMGDEFNYFECSNCGTLQINRIPENLAKFYPSNYYSFKSPFNIQSQSFKDWRTEQALKNAFGDKGIATKLISYISSKPEPWISRYGSKFNLSDKILDVGCGAGHLLYKMQSVGFKNLLGIDPFIEKETINNNGLSIKALDFFSISEQFDFIMFHHSFEHMDNPLSVFTHLKRVLVKNGFALIRIPVADSYAYKKYGANWANLDAPRHLFLHTKMGIKILCEQAKLELIDIFCDAPDFGITVSEIYQKGISLIEYNKGGYENMFTDEMKKEFNSLTNKLNEKMEGDWACFLIRN